MSKRLFKYDDFVASLKTNEAYGPTMLDLEKVAQLVYDAAMSIPGGAANGIFDACNQSGETEDAAGSIIDLVGSRFQEIEPNTHDDLLDAVDGYLSIAEGGDKRKPDPSNMSADLEAMVNHQQNGSTVFTELEEIIYQSCSGNFMEGVSASRASKDAKYKLNESTLRNVAMAAATAAGLAGGPVSASAAGVSTNDPHQTMVTQQSSRTLPPKTASGYLSSVEIDAALQKLEHRKMFKMKYTGEKKAIIGIGDYDYPIYRSGSPELAKYQSALNGARSSSEKFFWANGLVYANPNLVSKKEAEQNQIQVANMATGNYLEPAAAVQPPAAAVANASMQGHVAKMSDISSFVVKAQGLWDLRAKGGEIKARVNGREVTYTNQDEFVKDYVLINYKIFVQDKFGEKTNDTQVTKLMDDAISRVGR